EAQQLGRLIAVSGLAWGRSHRRLVDLETHRRAKSKRRVDVGGHEGPHLVVEGRGDVRRESGTGPLTGSVGTLAAEVLVDNLVDHVAVVGSLVFKIVTVRDETATTQEILPGAGLNVSVGCSSKAAFRHFLGPFLMLGVCYIEREQVTPYRRTNSHTSLNGGAQKDRNAQPEL